MVFFELKSCARQWGFFCWALLLGMTQVCAAFAEQEGAKREEGAIEIRSQILPPSSFSSKEWTAEYLNEKNMYPPPRGAIDVPGPAVIQWRKDVEEKIFVPGVERAKALYQVKMEPVEIDGVKATMVTPADGVPPHNRDRILINLHAGGFVLGGLLAGQIESIPVAASAQMPVLTVDYRKGPEHKFPAASIDVAAVYSHLLKTYKPENIGIYGCSAGGWLTAQAVAWFQHNDLPRPGAIGILCAGAGGLGEGDSWHLWPLGQSSIAYLDHADLRNPLVSPLFSPDVLSKFPPTLIVSSSRAADLSPATQTDIQLTKMGVISELHVWDGLGHGAFVYLVEIPEARDTAKMIANFFQRHLGRNAESALSEAARPLR